MSKKRMYSGDYFEVKRKDMAFGLGEKFESFADALKAIKAANDRAAIRGYKPDDYIVIHVEWYRYFDENGGFVKEETIKQICE